MRSHSIIVLRAKVPIGILLASGVFIFAAVSFFAAVRSFAGTPLWSVRCTGCTYNKVFVSEATLKQPYFVTSAVWSSDGKYLAIGSGFEGVINVYSTTNWDLVSTIWRWDIGGSNSLVRFSDSNMNLILPRIWGKNSKITAPTIDDNVSLEKWSVKNDSIVKKFYASFPDEAGQSFGWKRESSIARAVAVSSTNRLVAASVDDAYVGVIIYDESNANIIRDIQCQSKNIPEALAFSPDGFDIAVGGCNFGKVSIYNAKTGTVKFQAEVDPGSYLYNAIVYSPNGKMIAIGSSDDQFGTISILRSSDGHILATSPREHATITNLQWISDDLVLASYDAWHPDGGVGRLWDARSMHLVGEFAGKHLQLTAISPEGSSLAAVIGSDVIIAGVK
jgi:WD40 repeat protein